MRSWQRTSLLMLALVSTLLAILCLFGFYRSRVVPRGRERDEIMKRIEAMEDEMKRLGLSMEEQERILQSARCAYMPETEGCDGVGEGQG